MAAHPVHARKILKLTDIYDVCYQTYWALKMDFVEQWECHVDEFASLDSQSAWYGNCHAQNGLKTVISWLARTFKLFFIKKGKLSGNKWLECDYTDGPLAAAKFQMRALLEKILLEYSNFDEEISMTESQFIHTICLMDDWPTEDMAGALAKLAIHCICEGRPHLTVWRRYFVCFLISNQLLHFRPPLFQKGVSFGSRTPRDDRLPSYTRWTCMSSMWGHQRITPGWA
jgi:hypothetical protein